VNRAKSLAAGVLLLVAGSAVVWVLLARSATSRDEQTAAVMLVLVAAAGFFYRRSVGARRAVERMAREKEALLGISRDEARTDPLTNLANRRALASDLASAIADPPGGHELLLAILDLDGFKQYNDSYGHAAGDSLLQRLAARLTAAATAYSGRAYRLGGDEFCVFARTSPDAAEQMLDAASTALQEDGDGWHVGCSQGAAWIPSEAATVSGALKLADERMYASKTGRSSASRQVTDALLAVMSEQKVFIDEHVERVAELAGAVAQALGLREHEIRRIHLAARLHDIGKTAIPVAILEKPGPLEEREWEFVRRHPLIGERIVLAAPALAETAPLIRSSHERIDGHGYPDGLTGDEIPLGARIIAVCDAFDAMTSDRIYQLSIGLDAALDELKRHAGTQFDATVVDALRDVTALHLTPADEAQPGTARA